jgi:hypothetical protein
VEWRADAGAAVVRRHPDTGGRHLDVLKWDLLSHRTKEPPGRSDDQRAVAVGSMTAGQVLGVTIRLSVTPGPLRGVSDEQVRAAGAGE